MQISAISPSFQGKRDNIDAIISMDDNSIRQIAYLQTASKVDYKKNRNISNALFYSAPLAAGIGTAILGKGGTTKIFSKEVSGLAARAANGLKSAAGWAVALGAMELLGIGYRKLKEISPEYRKFDNENPLLSVGTFIASAFGVLLLLNKGSNKLAKVKAPEFMQKFAGKAERFINKNSVVQKMKNGALNLAKKTPDALKEIGAVALDWSPAALLLGGTLHGLSASRDQRNEFIKNYSALKDKQTALAQARVRELSIKNDILMQDVQNRQDMEILENPEKIVQEAVEQIENMAAEEA